MNTLYKDRMRRWILHRGKRRCKKRCCWKRPRRAGRLKNTRPASTSGMRDGNDTNAWLNRLSVPNFRMEPACSLRCWYRQSQDWVAPCCGWTDSPERCLVLVVVRLALSGPGCDYKRTRGSVPCGGDDRSASLECSFDIIFIGPPAKRFAEFPCLRPLEENPKGYRQDCRVARRCCLRYWDNTEGLSLARYSPALRYVV